MASMSSAQIVSATAIHNKLGLPGIPRPAFPGAGVRPLAAPAHFALSSSMPPPQRVAVRGRAATDAAGPNHITHGRQITARSDKHMIKRSGSKDNCTQWKLLFFCSNKRFLFFGLFFFVRLSVYLVMAGYDIEQPTRILTRVSFKLWNTFVKHEIEYFPRWSSLLMRLSCFWLQY